MALITAENAREMSVKGNASRWAKFHQARASQQLPVSLPPELPRVPILNHSDELSRVKRQIDSLYAMMDAAAHSGSIECPHCKKSFEHGADAHELDQLSRAYDRLFKAWMVLSGTPGSGQRKPVETRSRRTVQSSQGYHAPEEPVALPDPAPIVVSVPTPIEPETPQA